MTTRLSITDRATTYAREVSENGSVFVYERDGVYWLSVETGDVFRTLMAVGLRGCGIRHIRSEIATYFGDK